MVPNRQVSRRIPQDGPAYLEQKFVVAHVGVCYQDWKNENSPVRKDEPTKQRIMEAREAAREIIMKTNKKGGV
jgi:hypothetical protein